jgi:hypothetical protein
LEIEDLESDGGIPGLEQATGGHSACMPRIIQPSHAPQALPSEICLPTS